MLRKHYKGLGFWNQMLRIPYKTLGFWSPGCSCPAAPPLAPSKITKNVAQFSLTKNEWFPYSNIRFFTFWRVGYFPSPPQKKKSAQKSTFFNCFHYIFQHFVSGATRLGDEAVSRLKKYPLPPPRVAAHGCSCPTPLAPSKIAKNVTQFFAY